MKILVFAHRLEIGGTQVNAIELSAALRDLHGHEIVMFATPGPMAQFAAEKGLKLIPAPDATIHPSLARMAALRRAVRSERPDVVHAWDWPQGLEAYYGVALPWRLPLVVTDMSMVLTRFMPKFIPTTFGTPELVEQARRLGRSPLELLVPPVDVAANAPGAVDGQPFRQRHGIGRNELMIVTVSRLTEWMKAESLRRTMEVVGMLGKEFPMRFVVVGEGPSRQRLQELAATINGKLGREAIILAGPLVDPRMAYAASDVVIGMGGSGLRAMAFAKPLIVVGEQGYCAPFDASTAEDFYYRGIYGLGDGDPENERLAATLGHLLSRPGQFSSIGEFSRRFVTERFSLETLSARLSHFLTEAARNSTALHVTAADSLRTTAVLLGRQLIPDKLRQLHAFRTPGR
ncbi:glycosyltransferase family 4 protein [Azohydromonas aeria]|uniref:glycosyltransferase family 4 protein n=1 Tax=Azohydromonas aeria TaxID=2590212 RepID=UPI0012FA1970|nr:glycosyltransferase family 4 protein [Azohydromonas aeria]